MPYRGHRPHKEPRSCQKGADNSHSHPYEKELPQENYRGPLQPGKGSGDSGVAYL